MSAEIKVGLNTISYLKGPIAINITPPIIPLPVDVAGENSMHDVVSLTTTDTTLSKGNITTTGYVFLKNMDATNNALFGIDGTSYPMRLKPGEYGFFRSGAANIHAKSSASTVLLEYSFIEA